MMKDKKFSSLEDIYSEGKYILNQGIIFSEDSKEGALLDLANTIAGENFQETVDWLNSVTETKWNKLYESLSLLETEHKKNINTITNLLGVDKCIDNSGALEAIAYLQQSLNHIGYMLLAGGAIAKHLQTISAKQIRAKRNEQPNPNIEKARKVAIEIWEREGCKALLDTAYDIKNTLKLKEASTTIQEWIRDLNPNKKK